MFIYVYTYIHIYLHIIMLLSKSVHKLEKLQKKKHTRIIVKCVVDCNSNFKRLLILFFRNCSTRLTLPSILYELYCSSSAPNTSILCLASAVQSTFSFFFFYFLVTNTEFPTKILCNEIKQQHQLLVWENEKQKKQRKEERGKGRCNKSLFPYFFLPSSISVHSDSSYLLLSFFFSFPPLKEKKEVEEQVEQEWQLILVLNKLYCEVSTSSELFFNLIFVQCAYTPMPWWCNFPEVCHHCKASVKRI